ncbi:uncharacterized protein Dana_GF21163 [Drosophila ananassae]|uniref:Nose resistant-to-fluoxetine protein N-terminal domain-containing protein n=1 Tax=Drosophila ananassae TaxID=7217 RepID=B3MQV5_DROAN|nr:O-acyltransferase like protein [Drosophila ananassae]EDV34160.1 uncharacterized protein Dana_GF21163 [Drosophila ananassae]
MSSGSMLLQVLLIVQIVAAFGERESLLLDLVDGVVQEGNSGNATLTTCEKELLRLHDGLEKEAPWAVKARDASGEGFGDFMMGHSMWLGSPSTCRAASEPVLLDYTERDARLLRTIAPFPLDYLVAYVWPHSSWHLKHVIKEESLLHIGLCLPRSCDSPEIEHLLHGILAAGKGRSFRRWKMRPSLAEVKRPGLRADFFASRTVQLFLVLSGGQMLLCLLSSAGLAQYSKILACFDLRSNWQRAWQVSAEENSCINGLRVVTAFALLGVHVVWYKVFAGDPSLKLLETVTAMTMRHTYWPSTVEVFFVISGFLTVSNFLRDEQLQQDIASDGLSGRNVRRFLGQVFRRFLRLAPLQFMVMLLGSVGSQYQRQVSLLYVTVPHDEICHRHWWRNLLFVQNLFPVVELCGSWTWYLACDMQLYMLALLLLFLHTRHPRVVRWLAGLLLATSILYSSVMMELLQVKPNFEEFYQAGEWFYVSPVIRLLAYIVGGAYGYSHARGWEPPSALLLPNWWSKLALSLILGWLLQKVLAEQLPAASVLGAIMAVLRLLVATWAGHLILSGDGRDAWAPNRWLLTLLHSDQLQRMSRFTYAIYLLNPIIIIWFYHSFTSAINADKTLLMLLTVGHSGICYFLAIVATLLIELPFNRLSSLLTSSRSPRKKTP